MGGLTPEEEEELRQLEAEEAQEKVRSEGADAVVRAHKAATRTAPAPTAKRPFSLYRATVGALRDAAQGVIEATSDLVDTIRTPGTMATVAQSMPVIGSVIGVASAAANAAGAATPRPQLPTLKGEENAGTAERVVRTLGSYLVPYAAAAKAVGVARGASWLGRAGKAMLAGFATDTVQLDPVSGNMANAIRDTFGIKSDVLDALASEEDDDNLYTRFKAAAVNAPIGLAADAVFEAGFRAVKAYRAWKGGATEAEAAVKAARAKISLDPKARSLVPVEAAATDSEAGSLVRTAVRPQVDDTVKEGRAFNPETDISTEAAPKSFEDILDFLKKKSGLEVDDVALSRLAANILDGNPENALAKLGIDPAKLDFSLYDDPGLLGKLQKGLAEVYETIANRLGRSNARISEEQIAAGARALATSADVLKDLYGNTTNLAETLMASRLFVGAHAHQLLARADEAEAAIKAGGEGGAAAWESFMEAFHRHAYYLGTLRGAGSEVGRALRSLQMVARAGKGNAKGGLKRALSNDAAAQAAGAEPFTAGASHYLAELVTDADKLLALEKLRQLDGDVGELTRHVRAKEMTGLHRLDLALRETVGDLFSAGTAVWNIAAGGSMMGLKALTKSLLAVEKMALSPLGGRFSQAARVQLMDAWAYTDGLFSGFRDAFGHTMALLEREGMAEAAITLDGLGIKDLAKQAAIRSIEGSKKIGENFERADVINDRWFAMKPSERKRLKEAISSTSAPQLLQTALRGLVDLTASVVNTAGTMSRAGTILFINAPDQLVGTMAARAGAQAHAVRLAAQEAAELGLSGKELSTYLKARAIQLTSPVDGWAPDGFDMAQREVAAAHGAAEAREVLFQDDLELGFNRHLMHGLSGAPLIHLVVPFVKTPLRILERTALDFTPLGLLKDRLRSAILAGGPEGQEALIRMGLGMMAVVTAIQLADDRDIVGQDGGYKSSARLSRPSYSLRIGDDEIEFSRIDPLGTLLGMGADIAAFYRHNEDDPQAAQGVGELFEAMLLATTANILSKSWLTSLRNLTDLAGINSEDDFDTRSQRFVNSFAARIVPASGIQRTIVKQENFVAEAASFMDSLIGASIGAPTLPTKRDYLLGRPQPVEGLNRLVGVRIAPGDRGDNDPLRDELEDLSFDLPSAKRTIEGVRLNAAQFSRYLELKGQIVRKPETGLTLEETLQMLIGLPEYKQLNRAGRVQAMREELDGFSRLATIQLIREDKKFARDVLEKETWDALEIRGASREQKIAETQKLAEQLGLTPAQ